MWTESQIAQFLINFDRRGFFLHLVAFLDFRSIETKFYQSQNIGKISKKLTENGETHSRMEIVWKVSSIQVSVLCVFFPAL